MRRENVREIEVGPIRVKQNFDFTVKEALSLKSQILNKHRNQNRIEVQHRQNRCASAGFKKIKNGLYKMRIETVMLPKFDGQDETA